MKDVWEILDHAICRHDVVQDYRGSSLYPSESSCTIKNKYGEDETHGGCLRKSYLRYKINKESNMFPGKSLVNITIGQNNTNVTFDLSNKSARLEWIFVEGHRIESVILEHAKTAGIFYSGHKKFSYEIEPGYFLSGEVDALLEIDGQLVIAEIKSVSGYMSEKDIFGTPSDRSKGIKGSPRVSHLLQTALYVWKYKDQISLAKILYFMRGSCLREEFDVTVEEDVLKQDYKILVDGYHTKFTINGILSRYRELVQYLKTNTLPPRDFDLTYDDTKMNLLLSRGEIPKTKAELWSKYWDRVVNGGRQVRRPDHGDMECGWCSYQGICYAPDGSPVKY